MVRHYLFKKRLIRNLTSQAEQNEYRPHRDADYPSNNGRADMSSCCFEKTIFTKRTTDKLSFFRLQSSTFFCQGIINILKQQITAASLRKFNYSNYSFWKRAAQHAANRGILDKNIQKLDC